MRNILNVISFVTLFLAYIGLSVYGYWMLYPYNPIVINSLPMPVEPKVVKSGGILELTIDYCKLLPLPSVVSQRFIDTLVYARPTFIVNNPTGCHTNRVLIPVPEGLSPDEDYYIEQTYTYQVNPIRKIEVKSTSETFKIIK